MLYSRRKRQEALARGFHAERLSGLPGNGKGAPELQGCGLSRVTASQEPEHLSHMGVASSSGRGEAVPRPSPGNCLWAVDSGR